MVPEEAALVKRIFSMYLSGATLSQILRTAEAEGWPTYSGRGGRWSRFRISYILQNQAYLGYVIHHGEAYAAEHEPLVTVADWRAVQERLARRRAGYGRGGQGRRGSYASLLRCGICGGHVHSATVGGMYAFYRCAERLRHPRDERHPAVDSPRLMVDALIDQWTEHLIDSRVLEDAALRLAAEERDGRAEDLAEIDRELAQIETEMAYHHRAAARGVMPESVADDLTRPLMARRDDLLAQRERLTRPLADAPKWADPEVPAMMEHLWGLRPGERAEWLADLYERIDLHGPTLTIHHRVPLDPKSAAIPRHVRAAQRADVARAALGL